MRLSFCVSILILIFVLSCNTTTEPPEKLITGRWYITGVHFKEKKLPLKLRVGLEKELKNSNYIFNADSSSFLLTDLKDFKLRWSFYREANAILLFDKTRWEKLPDTLYIQDYSENYFTLTDNVPTVGEVELELERIKEDN